MPLQVNLDQNALGFKLIVSRYYIAERPDKGRTRYGIDIWTVFVALLLIGC